MFAYGGATSTSLFAIPHLLGGNAIEKGPGALDRTHRASFTYVYEFPFMREQRGFLGRVVGGWQIAGVTTFESGLPYTVFNGVDTDGIAGALERAGFNPNGTEGVRARPNVATAANPGPTGTPIGTVFYTNPDDRSRTLSGSPAEQFIDPNSAQWVINPAFGIVAPGIVRFTPMGRNSARTPGTNVFNMNFQKGTRITESVNIEFRTEILQYLQSSELWSGKCESVLSGDDGGFCECINFGGQPLPDRQHARNRRRRPRSPFSTATRILIVSPPGSVSAEAWR